MIDATSISTLAHEQIAKEEQNIGIFFASFAIQYYLHKDILSSNKMASPNFVKFFSDNELYASQRVFISNIITNKNFKPIVDDIGKLFMDYSKNQQALPYDAYLSRINKAFLIRQIFDHTDQTLSKYYFIKEFLELDVGKIDLNDLHNRMWNLPNDQQIMVLTRIFSSLSDEYESKKKKIVDSFIENVGKIKNRYSAQGHKQTQEYMNLETIINNFL